MFRVRFIPEELKSLNRWVSLQSLGKRGTKYQIPRSPETGELALVSDPETWGSFKEALAFCERHEMSGIGLVLTHEVQLVSIDLTACRDSRTGKIEQWAKDIIRRIDSYTEVLPSGRGVRIYTKGKVPVGKNNSKEVKMCDHGGFLTVTGRHLKMTPRKIKARSKQVDRLYRELLDGHGGAEQ
jgi:putative DNA primase/helicase